MVTQAHFNEQSFPIDFGDDGFQYSTALCKATGQHTTEAVFEIPGIYHWRGIHIGAALKRHLYIVGINSPALFKALLFGRGRLTERPSLRGAVEHRLPQYLRGELNPRKGMSNTRMIYLFLVQIWRWATSKFQLSQPTKAGERPDVLLYLANSKFIRYLEQTVEKFPKDNIVFLEPNGSNEVNIPRKDENGVTKHLASQLRFMEVFLNPNFR